jgi:ankyrin repeat protein
MDELQAKISSGASNVEGDYFALPPWNAMTNIQAALKGIDANKKKGTGDLTNTARMDIIMYLIENEAKTDYLFNYLKEYPLSKGYLTVWMDRLLETGAHDDLVESLAEIQTSSDSTPSVATKDYKAEMNAIFVTKKNTDPNASMNMLFTVAKDGSADNMTKMILNYRQNINAANESGRTPLMVAVENGNLGVVKAVFENENIRKNLLISKPDKEGNTAFIVACNAQPVNEELVNYLTGKLNYIDLFLKNNAGKTGHGILDDHKKRIDDEQAKPDYNRTKTPAEMATDAAQKISYVSLITTLDAIHKKEEDSAKAKVQSSVKAAVEKQQKVLDAATERNRIETLKNVLIKYINDNFKETYLVFIDATMRSTDKKWESLSKTCYRAMVKPNTCDNVKYITDLQSKKTALYTQIINYYKATGEWMSFEYIVKDVVLKGVKNLIDEKKTNIMDKIKDDIKKSEAELSAANRRADIDNVASYIPFKIGSSRRSKKRSASKTRKQKK